MICLATGPSGHRSKIDFTPMAHDNEIDIVTLALARSCNWFFHCVNLELFRQLGQHLVAFDHSQG